MLSVRSAILIVAGFSFAVCGILAHGYILARLRALGIPSKALAGKRRSFQSERQYWRLAKAGRAPKWPLILAAVGFPIGMALVFFAIFSNKPSA